MTDKLKARTFVAICAAFLMGYFPTFVSPWVVGTLVSETGLTVSKAGYLLSIEFLGIAIAGIAIGPFLGKFSLRHLAIAGASVSLLSHLVSIFIDSYSLLSAFRFIAGSGAGIAIAVSGAAVTGTPNPERTFSYLLIAMGVGSGLTQYAAGYMSELYGYQGILALLAAIVFLGILVLPFMPKRIEIQTTNSTTRLPMLRTGTTVLLATICFTAVQMGAWTFLERLGNSLDLSVYQLANILGIGSFVCLTGGIAAAWLNVRYGRATPIAIGLTINSIAILVLYTVPGFSTFVGGFLVFNTMWYFCMPYILGIASMLDPQGRWAAIVSSGSLLGVALGPASFGKSLDLWGIGSIGWGGFTFSMIALGILLIVIRIADNLRHDHQAAKMG